MTKKQILLLGLGATTIFPWVSVVSCSNNKTKQIISSATNFSKHKYSLIQIKNITPPSQNVNDYYVKDSNNNNIDILYDESSVNKETLNLKTNFIDSNSISYIKIFCKNDKDFVIHINHFKTFNSKDINLNKQYFFNLIQDMSQNNIPTLIETRDASLVIQQSFYISLVNYFNNMNNEQTNDFSVLMIHNRTIKSERFNENILKESGISSGIKKIEEIDQTNIRNINLINKFEHPNSSSSYNFVDHIIEIMEKFNISTKFDFVISDLSFINWIKDAINNPKFSKLTFVLKNANRIIVTSDGAAHTNSVTPYLNDLLYNFNPSSREEVINNFTLFQNGEKELDKEMILNLLLLKGYESINPESSFDFVSFFNYDANIQNSLPIKDENMWSINPFSTNFTEYTTIINDEQSKEKYLDVYSKLFIEENNLNNIIINGIESYDPNKRNAIFLGSSLFKPISGDISKDNFSRLQTMSNLRTEIQNQMKELLQRFPQEEYNIIFKLHPIYIDEAAINYVKLITDGIIENPIVISPNIPLETLIANDYYNFELDNGTNFIFKENSQYKAYEWTTFFGLQATTTTIHTTRLFYQTSFNLTKEETANLIPFYNFPIPTKFPVVNRIENDFLSKNYYEENLETILNIYSPFCPSITYNNEELKIYDSIVLNFTKE